jgi:tetratricopeptide (TPR) repeat protein
MRAAELAPEQADVLLAAAEMALLQGNLSAARDFVHRGLKLHPLNERLYRSLAALEAHTNHPEEAIGCLRLGLEKLPASVGLHVHLAELYLDQRQAAEARPLLDWVRNHAKSAGLFDYLQGRFLMLDGQWDEALGKLLAARGQLGLNSEWASAVCSCLGQCFEQLGEPEQQLAAYRSAVVNNPGNLRARLELGKTMLACRMVDDAAVELRNLTLLPQAPPESWVTLGCALIERLQRRPGNNAQWKELDDVLEQAARATPDAVDLACLRALRLMLQEQTDAALALLQKSIKERPGEVQLRITHADLLLRQGKTGEALTVLEQARAHLGPKFLVQQALARFWTRVGGSQAHLTLAQMAMQPGELTRTEMIRLLRELAGGLLQLGDKRGAETVGKQLADLQPKDLRPRIMLFDLALADNRDADTLRLLDEMRRIEGEDGVYWRAGEAARWIHLARKGDRSMLPLARKRLAEVSKRAADWGRAVLLQAYLDELDGFPEQAINHYRRAIDLDERSPALVLHVARWLYSQGRHAEADQVIRRLEEVLPLPADIARLGAEIALGNHDLNRALELARQAVPPASRDYRDQLWLARVQWLANQPLLAEETLRQLAKTDGRIPDVWIALVRHLARTQQQDKLPGVIQEMLQKLPADRAMLTLARSWAAAGKHDQAEECFKRALADSPGDLIVLRHFAEFCCRSDQFGKAQTYLRQLLDPKAMVPHDLAAWARRQLALGLAATDYQQALRLLESNTLSGTPTVEDERARAFVLGSQNEQPAEAVRLIELSLAKKTLSPDEQFLLAQLYERNGDQAKADELLLHLLAGHGDDGQYLAHQVRKLLQRGQVDDARFYFATLERLEPGSARTQQLQAAFRKNQ